MTNTQEVLQNCTVEGLVVKLPNVQLDRKLYQETAKALELIGGKWKGGKVFGFQFQSDPTELLENIANGEKRNLKKEFQFFATPEKLAEKLVYMADILDGDTILEPSAGQGAIIDAVLKLSCNNSIFYVEKMETNLIVLNKKYLKNHKVSKLYCIDNDFLNFDLRGSFSKIIANPPFSNNQDIDHIYKMYDCLKVGGTLVSISSESWVTGSQKKQIAFRDWLYEVGAEVIDIPRGEFKESGTMVGGKIIVINK